MQKMTGWMTEDGQFFKTQSEASLHEAKILTDRLINKCIEEITYSNGERFDEHDFKALVHRGIIKIDKRILEE